MGLLTDHLRPGKIFFRNREYDPQTVMAGIDGVSRYLSENLVSKSPFVYLFATNHIKTVFSYFGIIKARRICVIMDPKIGSLELEEKLLDTPPAACIRIDKATEQFDFSKEIELRNPPWKDDGPNDLSDVCTMIYTAAEDGYAKAAMLTHKNMLANAFAIAEGNKVLKISKTCALLPFCHSFGLQAGIITPMIAGGLTIVEEDLDLINSGKWLDNYVDFGITHFYSIPVVYYVLSKIKNLGKAFRTIHSLISGGYPLPERVQRNMELKHNVRIFNGYGLTEASPVCSWNYPDEPHPEKSIGRAIACCTIKIFDDQKRELPSNSVGEICIKGKNIMKGYYHHPEATDRILIHGWLNTGDLGYMNDEGFVFFKGLKKRMINCGGKKVYPAEVERLFSKNSNIEKIAIQSFENLITGQSSYAQVTLKDNSLKAKNELMKWGKRNISNFKLPVKFEFSHAVE